MEARKLTKILPVVLKQNQFKRTYRMPVVQAEKRVRRLCVLGCREAGGLGDISIRRMDLLNLFWEPGVRDIQDSEHFFSTELVSNEQLLRRYPQLEGKQGGSFTVSRFLYDDTVDTSDKSLVVDWYYHTVEGGRKVLQYRKFVGDTVLYATEKRLAGTHGAKVTGMDEKGERIWEEVPGGPAHVQAGLV